jgi:predicted aconitase
MLHIAGITPEAHLIAPEAEAVSAGPADLARIWHKMNAGPERIDLIALGSPHFSLTECRAFAGLMAGRQRHESVRVIITLGQDTLSKLRAEGLDTALQAAGVQIVPDLCWCSISEPVFPPEAKVLMTNSGKYAHYAPGLSGRQVRFGSLANCVDAACSGRAAKDLPHWLAG